MESIVLEYFSFNVGFPSPLHFAELLAARYGLSASSHAQLVTMCLLSVKSAVLWQGPSSLLALACVKMIMPGIALAE